MTSKRFVTVAVLAFIGAILFFNVNSAFAEENNLETLFKVLAGLSIASSLTFLILAAIKQGKRNPNDR